MADNVNDNDNDIGTDTDTNTDTDDIEVIKINKAPSQTIPETTHEESVLLLQERKRYVRDLLLNVDSDSTCSTGKESSSKIPPHHKIFQSITGVLYICPDPQKVIQNP